MTDAIAACRPKTNILAFVVGGSAYRVSIHTQQLRAFKLVHDLYADEKFKKCRNVAVIGGGIAGVTLAAALRLIGKNVLIYERKRRLIPLQYYSRTRYLHPTAINWPQLDLVPHSSLPILNWHCDFADHVALQIYNSFESQFGDRPIYETSCEVTSVKEVATPHNGVEFNVTYEHLDRKAGAKSTQTVQHDCVFFCTGFNSEKIISPYFVTSYWEDYSVRPIKSSLRPPQIAVVGDGDGGIIEIMRCFWRSRHFDEIYRMIAWDFISPSVRDEIIQLDEELKKLEGPSDFEDLAKAEEFAKRQYEIYKGALCDAIAIKYLRQKMEFDTSVHLFSRTSQPFSVSASPLHKAILSFLLVEKGSDGKPFVQHFPADINGVEYNEKNRTYSLKERKAGKLGYEYDRVIGRVGPLRGHSDLLTNFFGGHLDDQFNKNSNNYMDYANPSPELSAQLTSFYDRVQGANKAGRLLEMTQSLQSYLQHTLRLSIRDVSIQDAVLVVEYFRESTTSLTKIPDSWMGVSVLKVEATIKRSER
ncbi:NAD(P)-binding protein [Asticcacaulis machinosus]|uniref:NAD(P)-binding protein n=1 Tax=Asticcacaulis machinosus TaxID=2984211 RepID=A0ABT5HGY0_9CAUL|nr:NAD(P)-binding protein [Asticcacaulis machinosus]MDC7675510.1 NAD(P)-binding protein [Asticcacaulis machinosus]